MSEPTKRGTVGRKSPSFRKRGRRKRDGWNSKSAKRAESASTGLGRFPVTLYYEQWQRLLGTVEELKSFLEENKSKLKLKNSE